MSRNEILSYLDDKQNDIIDFLKKLISINSVNGSEDTESGKELEIQNFLADYLTKEGFTVDMFTADDKGVRPNICATLPGKIRDAKKSLIFSAHVDTVPVTELEKWHVDPFNEGEVDGKIYGRGANDMKGGLAAAIWAAKAIKDCAVDLNGDVILMLSCGEESAEGDTIGTRACVKRGYHAPFAVVCEPTSVEIHTSTASLMCFELIIPGKAIHTCCRNQVIFPQSIYQDSGSTVGVDAVEKALPFLEFFYRLEKEWIHRWKRTSVGTGGKPGHDTQGIGAFNINPSFVEAGTYIASVAGSLKVTYAVWHPAEVTAEDILREIRDRVAALAQTDDWLRENPPIVNGPVSQLWPGFITDENSEQVITLKKSYQEALGKEAVISGFRAVCDGTFLADEGITSVVCGPGAINDGGHGYNEFVRRSEVINAAKVYTSFIYDWCK